MPLKKSKQTKWKNGTKKFYLSKAAVEFEKLIIILKKHFC